MTPMLHVPLDADAVGAALDTWRAAHPGLAVHALVPEAELAAVPTLQEACRARGVPLVGAVFPRLVTRGGFVDRGAWLLRLDEAPPARLVDASGGATATVAGVRSFVEHELGGDDDDAPPTLFLLFDARVPHVASVVDGLYLALSDRVAYAGVNAGSETFGPMPCLFDAERLVGDGVWCLLLRGRHPLVAVHGYAAPSATVTATATAANGIRTIDWRPAFDVYQERVRADHGVELTRENFYQYAVHFPFGILRARGDVVVRIPVALAEDGTLFCVGEVPANAVLVLLDGPGPDGESTVRAITSHLGEALTDQPLLAHYCAGRRLHLGAAAEVELATLCGRTTGPIAGALTLGEIGNPDPTDYPVFHNAAIVAGIWDQAAP